MNKFLKTILIILGVCALMYLGLTLFATKKNMDALDQAKQSANINTIYNYIDKIRMCLLIKNSKGESDIPSFVTDKNFCTDEVSFIDVQFEEMESLELNIVNKDDRNELLSAIITYNGVTYSYEGETDTITVK